MILITIGVIMTIIVLWAASTRRKLAAMDENINSAMNQIGVQLSSRFDVLMELLDSIRIYAIDETQGLIANIESRRSIITSTSTPRDVLSQEDIIFEVLGYISLIVNKHPDVQSIESYSKSINAVDCYEKMLRTSKLIYNDSVSKFNSELHTFPTSLLSKMLGYSQREYL